MYTIIDIETTGLSSAKEKITEVAIYVFDGEKIIDEFISLVNPERPIPYFITRMTGITNEMVEDAPKFYEIAKEIIEITENRIFVAHNVEFDYGFIREEFASLGYDFKRKKLCTVKLSKKLIPGKKSYSLGKLTFEYKHANFLIIDKGRSNDEKSVVKIENGKYIGFGYFEPDLSNQTTEMIEDCIKPYQDNRDIQIIIKGFLNRNNSLKCPTDGQRSRQIVEKIIPF